MADEIIEDFLYLGDIDDARCAGEYSRVIDVRRWIEPNNDGYVDKATISALVFLLERSRMCGELVLVHCSAGMERSPLVVACYLHSYCNYTLADAYKLLKDKRQCVFDRTAWLKPCDYQVFVPEIDDTYCKIDNNTCVGIHHCTKIMKKEG